MDKNVRLIYLGRIKKIRIAVRKANDILGDLEFYEHIKGYRKFDSTDMSPDEIAKLMQENNHEILIKVSFAAFFISSYISTGNRITLSFWNFSRNVPAAVNTLVHATVNVIETLHRSASTRNDETTTAPWVIGAIAEVMAK